MSQAEHIDDKLIDYAYGELSPAQMRDAQAHLQTCPRCATALDEIRSVRRVMSQLPAVPAPADGLDSLISYAQQRAKTHAKPQPLLGGWRRFVWPMAGAVACLALVLISSRVVTVMRPLSAQIKSAGSTRSEDKLPSVESPESLDEAVVASRAPPPVREKGDLAKDETPLDQPDQRIRSDNQKELPQSAADVERAAPSEVAMGKKRDSLEQGPALEKPTRRSALKEEPLAGRGGAGALANENKSVVAHQASPPPPPQDLADYRRGKSAEKSKKAPRAEPDDGVEGGVEGGVAGGVVGGIAGSAPASEEVVVTGQRIRPSSPTSRYAQPPPKKPEPQGSSESLGREVTSVRQSLSQGATGTERARLLNRLCELLFELGQELDAIAACDAVLKEFPDTPAAGTARTLKANFSKAVPRPAAGKPGPSPSP